MIFDHWNSLNANFGRWLSLVPFNFCLKRLKKMVNLPPPFIDTWGERTNPKTCQRSSKSAAGGSGGDEFCSNWQYKTYILELVLVSGKAKWILAVHGVAVMKKLLCTGFGAIGTTSFCLGTKPVPGVLGRVSRDGSPRYSFTANKWWGRSLRASKKVPTPGSQVFGDTLLTLFSGVGLKLRTSKIFFSFTIFLPETLKNHLAGNDSSETSNDSLETSITNGNDQQDQSNSSSMKGTTGWSSCCNTGMFSKRRINGSSIVINLLVISTEIWWDFNHFRYFAVLLGDISHWQGKLTVYTTTMPRTRFYIRIRWHQSSMDCLWHVKVRGNLPAEMIKDDWIWMLKLKSRTIPSKPVILEELGDVNLVRNSGWLIYLSWIRFPFVKY